jgi:hypothetical protein
MTQEQEVSGMEQLRQSTEEFVNLLSEISEKYGIESEDIQAMNSGLEKVWNSVTMSEDYEELPEGIEEVEVAEELPEELEEEENA